MRNEIGGEPLSTRLPKSRDHINAIMGTWIVSYSIGSSSYTDKFILDDTYTGSNGTITGKGLHYSNQNGVGNMILCSYSPIESINIDYLCVTKDSFLQGFAFSFSNNTLTTGFYAIGATTDDIVLDIALKRHPLTGYRVLSQNLSEPIFDDTNNQLIIPSVKYHSDNYRVILKKQDDWTFSLDEVSLIQ